MLRVRVAAGLAIAGPPVTGAASLVVARMNPTYDPIHKSVSRLATIGLPGGNEMDRHRLPWCLPDRNGNRDEVGT